MDKRDGDKGKEAFIYDQKALVASIGSQDGVMEGTSEWMGKRVARGVWSRRRRATILLVWLMYKLDGREIARR